MALKAVRVSDVPNLDQVPESASLQLYSTTCVSKVVESSQPAVASSRRPKFLVIGHRGNGMNAVQSSDQKMKAFKENTIMSFNAAAKHPLDLVEFDVQVTKDGCPVIFHDDFILTEDRPDGAVSEKRVTELCLTEFLNYGPQREPRKERKPLLRKNKDSRVEKWEVEQDDKLCTLQEAFEKVESSIGFNIEIKFDDYISYQSDDLTPVLESILKVVFDYAGDRPVVFSTFQPDAAILVKKLQSTYPVFFLTEGGTETYYDERRNSLEEAMKLCLEGGLEGIVSDVRGIFRNPGLVSKIKESRLSLLTYGKLNNVPEAVYMEYLMGIDGVIVDLVEEITAAVCDLVQLSAAGEEEEEEEKKKRKRRRRRRELSFLLMLISELI